MLITKVSAASGEVHTREINITQEQLKLVNEPNGALIQSIVPFLSADDREFLLTGITPEEWKALFPDEE